MDFHSLTRKELQALCKNNKIPANMTNVAMADALKALNHVEGLSENPEILSPVLPCSTRRTSTRRKPVAEIGTVEYSSISEISDTPVTRNGRRRAAASSVRRNIETHMKEENEGEEGGQKENPVPVHSVRRSSRLSEKRISESIQKKGLKRTEAVKITVLSEEEPDDLEEEKSIEGSEISMLEEYKVTNHMFTGEVFNNRVETIVAEESSVVDSSDATLLESPLSEEICKPTIEEADESVIDGVVSVTAPVVKEVHGSGSLATQEKEKEIHGQSEPGSVENKDGAALIPESLSPGKICNSASKESIAETSSPRGSTPAPNVESVLEDLTGYELQGMDSCKVDEDCETDDENTKFGVQNHENSESGEGLTMGESEMTSDCASTLSAGDEIDEFQPLETKCSNLCPTEISEMVDNKECNCGSTLAALDSFVGEVVVEVLSEAKETSSLPPEKTSEIQPLETRCSNLGPTESPVTGCNEFRQSASQLVLQLENITNQLAGVVLQSQTVDLVSDQQQKMNDELENVADPVRTEVLAIEKHAENESSFIDDLKACFSEGAKNGTAMSAGGDSFSIEVEEEEESNEDPNDFHFENEEREKCVQAKEPGTDINAGNGIDKSHNDVVSSFSPANQEDKSSQERDLNVVAHVTTADVTATAATAVIYCDDIPMPDGCNKNNKSGSASAVDSTLDLGDKISPPSPAFNPILTPKKSLKKSQTPGKSGNKKQTSIGLMAFEDDKENNYEISAKKLDLVIASQCTAQVEMENKKDMASVAKKYEDMSKRMLIKTIKEKEKQLESKRTALQTLNKS